MGQLFGKEGLNVNILRGEIYPHYFMNPEDKDFETDANINIQLGMSPSLLITAAKKVNEYVVVAVNKTLVDITTTMKLKDAKAAGNLKSYTTDLENGWKEGTVSGEDNGSYTLTVPPMNVVTYLGNVK